MVEKYKEEELLGAAAFLMKGMGVCIRIGKDENAIRLLQELIRQDRDMVVKALAESCTVLETLSRTKQA